MTNDEKEDTHYAAQAKRREIRSLSIAAMVGLIVSGRTRGDGDMATRAISMGRTMYQALEKAGLGDDDD